MSNGGRFFSNNRFLEDSHSSSFEKIQMLSILLMGAKIFLDAEMLKNNFFPKRAKFEYLFKSKFTLFFCDGGCYLPVSVTLPVHRP